MRKRIALGFFVVSLAFYALIWPGWGTLYYSVDERKIREVYNNCYVAKSDEDYLNLTKYLMIQRFGYYDLFLQRELSVNYSSGEVVVE